MKTGYAFSIDKIDIIDIYEASRLYRIMPKVTSADSIFTKFLSLVMLVAAVKAGLYIHLAHLHVSPPALFAHAASALVFVEGDFLKTVVPLAITYLRYL